MGGAGVARSAGFTGLLTRTAHNSKCVTMPNRHELSYPRRTHAAALMMAAAAAPVEGVLLCRWPAPPAPLAARAACCLHHHLHLRHCIAGAATAVPVPPDACSSSTCRAGSSSIAGCRVGADLESRPAAGAAAYAWAAGKARARPLQPRLALLSGSQARGCSGGCAPCSLDLSVVQVLHTSTQHLLLPNQARRLPPHCRPFLGPVSSLHTVRFRHRGWFACFTTHAHQ